MNIEILFRGKSIGTGEWLYGYLFNYGLTAPSNVPCISVCVPKSWKEAYNLYAVSPDTIGQYTGLKDKNGVKIFVGDIARFSYITDGIKPIEIECLAKVIFEDGSFMIKCVKGHVHDSMQRALFAMDYFNIKVEVVGNITDNPELMK